MNKILVAACGIGFLALGCTAPAEEEQEPAVSSSEAPLTGAESRDLATARAGTAKYHDVNVAIADGYVADPVCATNPFGPGAMGIHYVNQALTFAPPRADKPSILLYEPTADGLRLVGVEWFQAVIVDGQPWFMPPNAPPPADKINPAPTLFGLAFEGPMPGHNPHMPWHYDLHAWIWKNNPDGLFSAWNTNVTCP